MKVDNQVTGNSGLYYTCFKLSCMGWNVMPTSRNAQGVDIIAYSQDGTHFIGVQVKTLTKRNPVPLGKNIDRIMGHFWVIVNNVPSGPKAFILLPEEIKKFARKGEKDGRVSYWLRPSEYDTDVFGEAWDRIK